MIQSRINAFLGHTMMSAEFAHTVLHKQNALNRPPAAAIAQIPSREAPKPPSSAATPPSREARAAPSVPNHGNNHNPASNNNKPVNYHYQKPVVTQEDREKRVQDYYDKLREQARPPIPPRKEHHPKPPEPVIAVHKPTPSEKKVGKNPSVGALIDRPREVPHERHPKPPRPPVLEEKARPLSKPVEDRKMVPVPRPSLPEEKPKPKPKVQPKPPPPNFYVPDYKPFKYEEPPQPQHHGGAIVIPAAADRKPENNNNKKPAAASAEQKKKLAALKEKARKEEQEKLEQQKEQKKREEERSERMKKRDEERMKMKAEIEAMKRKGKKSSGEGVGFCLVQSAIQSDPKPVMEKKPSENSEEKIPATRPMKSSEMVVAKPVKRKSKPEENFVVEKKPVVQLQPAPVEIVPEEEKREDIKDPEEIGRETAKFAVPEPAAAEKAPIAPGPAMARMDEKVTPKSIRMQVEVLTKSLLSRQRARLKEEEQLEQDMVKLANEYKEVIFAHIKMML